MVFHGFFSGSTVPHLVVTQAMASDFSALLLENPHKKTNCYIKEVPVTLQDQRFAVNQSKTCGKVINREV